MKTKHLLIVIFSLVLLASCKMGFNKQKFTNLKSLKKSTERPIQEKEMVVQNTDEEILNYEPQESDLPGQALKVLDAESAKIVKKAIEDSIPIYVIAANKVYIIERPFYDQFYNAVGGVFTTANDSDYVDNERVEIIQDEFKPAKYDPLVYLDDASSVEKKGADGKVTADGFVMKNEQTNAETQVNSGVQRRMTLKEHKSSFHIVKLKKKMGGVLIAILLSVILSLIGLVTTFLITVIGLVIAYVVIWILLTGVLADIRRNKKVALSKNLKPHLNALGYTIALWAFLFLFTLPLLLIPFLISLAFVASN